MSEEKLEGVTDPVSEEISEETQQVLDELRSEGYDIEGDADTTEEATEETPKEPSQEQKTEETPEEEPEVNRSQKEPALIPAWEHKVAEKKWQKEREQLESELQQLREQPTQENKEAVQRTTENLRELAEQHGLVIDESQEQFFNALLQKAVPTDMQKKLEAYERSQQLAFLETQFEEEFTKDVAPLIEEKYGVLDQQQLAELKRTLHDQAFTEAYAKVPLKKVFLAEESDYKLQRTNDVKSPVHTARSGKSRVASIDFESVGEEDLNRMSDEDVERYTEHMIQKAGGKKWR